MYWLSHEVLAFLNVVQSDQHYALYVTALNTGMRRGELLGLQWDKVDFPNKQIEVSRIRDRYGIKNTTKTGKIVFIPMNDIVIKTLLTLKQEARALDFVFVELNGKQIDLEHVSNRPFKKAIEKAQVRPIKFHNLRSTFAANFCMNGGDVYTLSKILNHSSVEMTSKKYAHLHPSYLLNAIQNVAFEANSPDLAHNHLRVV
jgi:integrase